MSNENIVQQAQQAVSFEGALEVVTEIRQALSILGPKLNEFDYEQRWKLRLQSDLSVDYPVMWYSEDDFASYFRDKSDYYTWLGEGWMSSSQWKDC